MGIVEAINTCFRKYFTFSGRASRSEYWFFILFCFLISIGLVVLNSSLFGPTVTMSETLTVASDGSRSVSQNVNHQYNGGWFGNVFTLAVLVPMISAGWRRLHDIGKRGFWIFTPLIVTLAAVTTAFLSVFSPSELRDALAVSESIKIQNPPGIGALLLLPFASWILTLYWLCKKSQPGSNRYGPNPHEVSP